jgi:diadenosine tetraphosphate (Ap4A) HIT family hydrolase
MLYPTRLHSCPFCSLPPGRVWIETEHAVALPDADPVADGHTIVAPRAHVNNIYALTTPEQQAVWQLVSEVRERLLTGLKPPDGFSIGFTDSLDAPAASHVHVHVVPRRRDDALQLRDGIEWVTEDDALAWRR